ncbi:conserved protein of unknown function (plasmid) [Rhodovastum atsumiense]|uniref:Uncharacterized protein n=1 Tax=Rhodovastum atsumiense TaxID=504468 RepID=A0A5M6IU93_9PROT|nr:hypothetical protein [Rhodovastum atsumiense]KAA5611842.1 hypothetical protein F1189_12460 [Rhodovastum atsumiense]CAH2606187.1 conserved protein of unknown function [Rhodovastum atsumiense]
MSTKSVTSCRADQAAMRGAISAMRKLAERPDAIGRAIRDAEGSVREDARRDVERAILKGFTSPAPDADDVERRTLFFAARDTLAALNAATSARYAAWHRKVAVEREWKTGALRDPRAVADACKAARSADRAEARALEAWAAADDALTAFRARTGRRTAP